MEFFNLKKSLLQEKLKNLLTLKKHEIHIDTYVKLK